MKQSLLCIGMLLFACAHANAIEPNMRIRNVTIHAVTVVDESVFIIVSGECFLDDPRGDHGVTKFKATKLVIIVRGYVAPMPTFDPRDDWLIPAKK